MMISSLLAATVATVTAYEAFTTGVGIGLLSVGLAKGASKINYNMKR